MIGTPKKDVLNLVIIVANKTRAMMHRLIDVGSREGALEANYEGYRLLHFYHIDYTRHQSIGITFLLSVIA